jgi:hypothetical protein
MTSSGAHTIVPMTLGPVRCDGVEVNEVSDGLVVYDTARERVHYLNHTAALILELCTGDNDAAGMAAALGDAYDLDEVPIDEVRDCLDQLRREGLIREA